jgi:membrane associated rhomboid family serine protease
VFALELHGGEAFVTRWSVVPADIVSGHHWITVLTSMFMHAGWMHIIGNMVFLWAFGPEIEDAMGGLRYLVFYLLSGITASLVQIAITPASTVPNLGASGAIAGVMGAFLITYPADQIKTVLFLGWFVRIKFIPAVVLIGVWFLIQLFNGMGPVTNTANTGGVAYAAHVGGFVFGLVFARPFERGQGTYQYGD